MPLPRLLVPLLAGALALTCTACAEGPVGRSATPDRFESDDRDEAGQASQSPSTSPSPSPSATALSEQEATATASRLLLVPEDLPGSTASPADPQTAEALAALWQDYRTCTGADAERLADVPSDVLTRTADGSGQLAAATSAVLADPGALATALRGYRSEQAAGCASDLATDITTTLAGPGVQLSEPFVEPVRTGQGATQTFGHRVTTTATREDGQQVPVSVDVGGVAAGRTEVLVLLLGSGAEVPVEDRDALLGSLAERVAGEQ